MKHPEQDIALIDRILKGDQSAYPALIRRHKDYAFTVAFRILNTREDAEEVAQDAFMQAFGALATFNREAKFTTWFYRIVFNAALAFKRKNRIFTEPIENATAEWAVASSVDELQKADQQRFIQEALSQLSPDDVAMITLFYLKEFSLEEIAEILNITADTAKVKVHRARKRLAEQMKKQLKGEVLNLY